MSEEPPRTSGSRLARSLQIDRHAFGAFKRPGFKYLLMQQFAGLSATFAINFASLDKVVGETGSGVKSAFTILSVVVPGLLFGLLGGVTVDRVSRRTILIVTNVMRGLLALAAPLYLGLSDPAEIVTVVLVVNFVLSAVGQFNFPAEAALIPFLVTPAELLGANTMANLSYLAAVGFGSIIWGPLSVRFLGTEWAYFGSGILYMLSLVPLYRLPKDAPIRERAVRPSRFARLRHLSSALADVKEGFAFAAGNPSVGIAILSLISQTALALGLVTVVPVVMVGQFGIPMYYLPLLVLPAAVGGGVGLLLMISSPGSNRPRTHLVVGGNILIAFGLVLMTLSLAVAGLSIAGALVAVVLVGGGFVLAYISGKSVLQEEPPDYLRGRVISLQLTLNNVVSLVPTVLAGWGLDELGSLAVFAAFTAVFVALAAYTVQVLRRRRM